MKALRSLLNVPANRADLVAKAPGYGADALILDLEDAVPLEQKAVARGIVRDALEHGGYDGPITYVRINALGSGLVEDDLEAVVMDGLAGIQVPKVDDPADVVRLDALLTGLERSRGLPGGTVELLVSLESARGVWFAYEILTAAPRVGSVMIATAEDGDLHGDLGYRVSATEEETLYVRSRVLLAARAAGIANPIDGVYARHRDLAGLEASARRARDLGYRGKKVIHPAQVEVVNRVFAPTEAELEHHRRVLATFAAALAEGRATAVVDGRMVDYAMAETARRVLERSTDLDTHPTPPESEGGP